MHTYTNLPVDKILKPIEYYHNNSFLYRGDYYDNIRNIVLESSKSLQFKEENHSYLLNGKSLISVTNLCKLFQEKQDFNVIAQKYAKKHNLGDWTEIKRQWDLKALKSVVSGKLNHAYAEGFMNIVIGKEEIPDETKQQIVEGYYLPVSPKQEAIVKYFYDTLNEEEIPLLSETKVYNKDFLYSGTFDKLVYQKESDSIVIRDYKTNESLVKDFKKPLLYPFTDFNNEDLSIYTIQLSLYQLCLEQIGIKVKKREIVWLKDDGNYELISLKDVTPRLLDILPFYLEKNYFQ